MPEAAEPKRKSIHRRHLPEHLQVPWNIRDVLIVVLVWFGGLVGFGIWLGLCAHFVPVLGSFVKAIQANEVWASLVWNVLQDAWGVALVALFLRRYHVGWKTVGWRSVSLWTGLKYLLGILVIFFVLAQAALWLVTILVPGFNANQPQTNEFTTATGTHRNLALVALVLMPPIFEETIFRGFIFPALAKRTGVIWGAVIASVLFGLAHGQANIFVYTFILGLLLCFMYVRTRSIIPGILLHMLNNYLAFLALAGK